ncbi:MAG: hypothetical protein ACXVSX_01955 [Solirubrobacteraceae bacterium]
MRWRSVVGVVLCALAIGPARALAHGDEGESTPAPDALAAGAVYYPYEPVSVGVARRLDRVVEAADARGLFLKVALIAGRDDLGDLVDFYGRPEEYAAYLARQLPGHTDASGARPALLVVMPSGLGFDHWPRAGRRAARGLQLSVGADSDAVAVAAAQVVQRTMAATGRPVPAAVRDDFGRGPRVPRGAALALAALIALGAAGVGASLRRRRRAGVPA